MGDRRARGPQGPGVEHVPSASELAADDRFLDALGAGDRDASGAGAYGTDSYLSSLFAGARADAAADLPPLPALDPCLALGRRDVVDVEAIPVEEPIGDQVDAAPNSGVSPEPVPGGSVVRGPATWWKPSRVGSALIGAAASVVLISGGLSAVHSAAPGGALWPARVAMFGDSSVEVELASTLEEADAASDAGDVERAKDLLRRAEELMASVDDANREAMESRMRESEQKVRTVTAVPPTVTRDRTTTQRATETRDPQTVTQTEVRTETRTETVTSTVQPSSSTPSSSTEPSGAPMSNGTGQLPGYSDEPIIGLPQNLPRR